MRRIVLGAMVALSAMAPCTLGQSSGARAASVLAFADERHKAEPKAPVHLFAQGANTTVNVVTPSGPIRAHYHAKHEETVVILRGKGRMRIGNEEREVAAGDAIFLPANTVHDFRPDGGDVVAVSVFSPRFDGEDRIWVDK